MRVSESRFAELVGTFCPGSRCEIPVLWCTVQRAEGRALFDAEPHVEGTWRLADTGQALPLASVTTVQARFGRQGTLHRRHDAYCGEAAKAKRRKR